MARGRERSATRRQARRDERRGFELVTPDAEGVRERAEAVAEGARSHPRILLLLAAVLVVFVVLYGPMRDYYVAMRSGQDLQAYYDALAEQNEELGEEIRRLQTREGVEDEARKHGLVEEGETGVVVDGMEGGVKTPLPEVQMEDTRPWYVEALDAFFGYEYGVWQ